ncbi:MAG: KH domain-containing protein [Mycobacterium sp.]|uniref:KH domain-containing protein n=1 Tax=Mycobacterium sp. TaxID=1785 RepID=UPI003F9C8D13
MGDSMTPMSVQARGAATTGIWQARCKDCEAERAAFAQTRQRKASRGGPQATRNGGDGVPGFEYSSSSAQKTLDRGNSRSDRCERHRRSHRQAIQALAVAYIDLRVIGEVANPRNPSGPLGGLGSLPVLHTERTCEVGLDRFGFGMTDADILDIIDGLATKRVAVIEAGTGTGKSTFMPFRLMNPPEGARLRISAFGPIVVTEPRRAAATGVARFVGEELCFGHDSRTCKDHIGPGYPVGYQVSGEKHWDSACDLIYVTDGTMINWVRDGQLSKIGTVIIDEAHERSENIDIILAQLREKVRHHSHLRVIITSATLDKDFFVAYFGGPDHVFHHFVPAKKSFGYGVPLFIGAAIDDTAISNGLAFAANGDVDTTSGQLCFPGWGRWGPPEGSDPPDDLRAVTRTLEKLRCIIEPIPPEVWKDRMPAALAMQVVTIAAGTEWGDILGFLPTSEAIRTAVEQIKEGLAAKSLDFDVYPLLSTTEKRTSELAIAARVRGERRKIVISSNLAETSLTVKGVRYVVDSGLICQSEWDPDIASGSFPTKPYSQSGLRQRWGRVGRDAPGWVFPLYTPGQFLALPRNTPPGSTQTNLETFYAKLIAAGVDLEDTALPANFVHETVSYDQDARKSIEVFNKESTRALRALSLSGAVDGDGHLTEFGRELERFPGDGSRALAIMLADQLACVHEVAVALEVLGQGRLIGHDEDRILRVSRDWPAAWRVAAAQRHRALAIGCTDDLDILLLLFALWQRAANPAEWCNIWWINEAALESALRAAMATVETLSAAMKGTATRPIMPELAGRARAVLSRAMVSQRYERVAGRMFRLAGDADAEQVMLGQSQLVDAGDRILAFNRFRPGASGDPATRTAIISHTVRSLEWAETGETGGPGSVDMGIELMLRAAAHSASNESCPGSAADPLGAVRTNLPVGAIVDMELQGDAAPIREIRVTYQPFAFPGDDYAAADGSARRADPSGFDRDWDPNERSGAEMPEEEVDHQILDPRVQEENDTPLADAPIVETTEVQGGILSASFPSLYAVPLSEGASNSGVQRAVIIGYRVMDKDNVALLIDPMSETATGGDPARHDDLTPWQEIDLVVRGIVRDHETDFLQLDRSDGLGRFYLNADRPPGLGLDPFDMKFGHRLAVGARIAGKAIPRALDPMSATLLPTAVAHLGKADAEGLNSKGLSTRFFPAEITQVQNERGDVLVALNAKDMTSGLSHVFEVRQRDLRRLPTLRAEIGQKLLVAVRPHRSERKKSLSAEYSKAADFAAEWSDYFIIRDRRIRASDRAIPRNVINGLLLLDHSDRWTREVWEFYEDNLHVVVEEVRPQLSRVRLAAAPSIIALLGQRKTDILGGFDITLAVTIDKAANEIEVSGPDSTAVDAAIEVIRSLADLPRVCADLPAGTAGMVIGKEQRNRKRLEARTNVRWLSIAGDRLIVVGNSANAVLETIKDIRQTVDLATGELFVPASVVGRFIGTGGKNIRALCDSTGCRANNGNSGEIWRIEGPTRAAVEQFIRLSGGAALGSTGRVVSAQKLNIIEDTTKKSQVSQVGARSSASNTPRSGQERSGPEHAEAPLVDVSVVRPGQISESSGASVAFVLAALVAIVIAVAVLFIFR